VLVDGDYSSAVTQADSRAALANWLAPRLRTIEQDWTLIDAEAPDLISSGSKLTLSGEDYLLATIPGLRTMAPALFAVQVLPNTITPRTFGTTYADSLAADASESLVGQGLQGASTEWGPSPGALGAFLTLGLFLIVIIASQLQWQNATAGLVIGAPVLFLGAAWGIVPLTILGLFTFIMGLFVVYALWFKPAY
jgi:hypothetical protein